MLYQIIVLVCYQTSFVSVVNTIQRTTTINMVLELSRTNVGLQIEALVYDIQILA
jgi:hypothetical protein